MHKSRSEARVPTGRKRQPFSGAGRSVSTPKSNSRLFKEPLLKGTPDSGSRSSSVSRAEQRSLGKKSSHGSLHPLQRKRNKAHFSYNDLPAPERAHLTNMSVYLRVLARIRDPTQEELDAKNPMKAIDTSSKNEISVSLH